MSTFARPTIWLVSYLSQRVMEKRDTYEERRRGEGTNIGTFAENIHILALRTLHKGYRLNSILGQLGSI